MGILFFFGGGGGVAILGSYYKSATTQKVYAFPCGLLNSLGCLPTASIWVPSFGSATFWFKSCICSSRCLVSVKGLSQKEA